MPSHTLTETPRGSSQSPDLLATLEDVLEWIQTGEVDGVGFDEASIVASIKESLAKATGRAA